MKTRNNCLVGILLLGVITLSASALGGNQLPSSVSASKSLGAIPNSRDQQSAGATGTTGPDSMQKQMREQNAAEIKAKVDRLYDLASELKSEVNKADLNQVLSTGVVKKAHEIERLAKEVKNRSKG